MFSTLKTKIWLTILSIVLMFALFVLFYFPSLQEKNILKNYNDDVQNLANTVALGVNISLNEQNYDGIKTAMEYVKNNPDLKFVSLVKTDTSWQPNHTFTITNTVVQTYPENRLPPLPTIASTDSLLVKHAAFVSSDLSGFVLLGISTNSINETKKQLRYISLAISSVILVIGSLLGLWLARTISVPVSLLRNAARRVSEGDLSQVSIRQSNDEIGDLARAFNKMLTDLFRAREELHNSNRTLSQTNSALNKTLTDLKSAQNQLIQSEKMASLGELTAGIAHEIQNPLNFVNNFSEVSIELAEELKEELHKLNLQESEAVIDSLADSLVQNQYKINQHGKRADSIVKGMLQHSRKSTGQKEWTDINALTDEYLRLSYHGLRAKDKTFNAAISTDFEEGMNKANVIPQEISRVLLNLYNNAFYAVLQKQKKSSPDYKPVISVATRQENGIITICVRDNGDGIPKPIGDKIFQPFFTTKPSGDGTGLGLSLSYDIITKGHNGKLYVRSEEGEYAEFIIELPVA